VSTVVVRAYKAVESFGGSAVVESFGGSVVVESFGGSAVVESFGGSVVAPPTDPDSRWMGTRTRILLHVNVPHHMPGLDSVDGDELRDWLDHVHEPETTKLLMVGLAVDEGVDPGELSSRYGLESEAVEGWVERLESEPLIVVVAEHEGVDFGELAAASGLGRGTILDWFRALDDRPTDEAAEIVRRYGQRSPGPLLSGTESRVQYLNYEVLEEHGWSLDDEDLFEEASAADLDPADYGRFLVESGETILEAAENRGISWPYACRGGACANCAVVVKEGDIAMPGQTILTDEQVRSTNARLTCVGVPVTRDLKLVMNVQHLDQFQDLRLPSPISEAGPSI
jgi:ferredoxin